MRLRYSWRKMAEAFANSEYPDQTPHIAASDLGLQCMPITLLGVSRLQWVNSRVDVERVQLFYYDEKILLCIRVR